MRSTRWAWVERDSSAAAASQRSFAGIPLEESNNIMPAPEPASAPPIATAELLNERRTYCSAATAAAGSPNWFIHAAWTLCAKFRSSSRARLSWRPLPVNLVAQCTELVPVVSLRFASRLTTRKAYAACRALENKTHSQTRRQRLYAVQDCRLRMWCSVVMLMPRIQFLCFAAKLPEALCCVNRKGGDAPQLVGCPAQASHELIMT